MSNQRLFRLFSRLYAMPMVPKVARSGKLLPNKLVTDRFAVNDITNAYHTFGNAAKEGALEVVLTSGSPE